MDPHPDADAQPARPSRVEAGGESFVTGRPPAADRAALRFPPRPVTEPNGVQEYRAGSRVTEADQRVAAEAGLRRRRQAAMRHRRPTSIPLPAVLALRRVILGSGHGLTPPPSGHRRDDQRPHPGALTATRPAARPGRGRPWHPRIRPPTRASGPRDTLTAPPASSRRPGCGRPSRGMGGRRSPRRTTRVPLFLYTGGDAR